MSEAEVVPLRGPGRPPKQTVEAIVADLEEKVGLIIAENRRLRRELEQVGDGRSELEYGDGRKALRRLHRKVQQAVS